MKTGFRHYETNGSSIGGGSASGTTVFVKWLFRTMTHVPSILMTLTGSPDSIGSASLTALYRLPSISIRPPSNILLFAIPCFPISCLSDCCSSFGTRAGSSPGSNKIRRPIQVLGQIRSAPQIKTGTRRQTKSVYSEVFWR